MTAIIAAILLGGPFGLYLLAIVIALFLGNKGGKDASKVS